MKRRFFRHAVRLLVIFVFVSFVLCFTAARYQPAWTFGVPSPDRITVRQIAFGVPMRAVVDEPMLALCKQVPSGPAIREAGPTPYYR